MDPFSLTTGVVTLLGLCIATTKIFNKIRSLKEAPELIQALNNELSDLQLLIASIDDHLRSSAKTELCHMEEERFLLCSHILEDTQQTVIELENFLQRSILRPNPKQEAVLEINRTAFLKEHGQLARLQMQLQRARRRITSLFSSLGMRDATKVKVLLSDIRFNVKEIKSNMQQGLSALSDRQAGMETALEHLLKAQHGAETALFRSSRGGIRQDSANEGIEMLVARVRRSESVSTCLCSRQRISGYLETFLGSIFIGYTAAPSFGGATCCFCEEKRGLVLAYYFPNWFVKYVVSFRSQHKGFFDMTFSLSIAQLLPANHTIFDLITKGDIHGMKQLFRPDKVSIRAETPFGHRLLDHSILTGNLDSTEFLLKIGADPFAQYPNPISSYIRGWDRILAKFHTVEWRTRLKSLLPTPDFDEIYKFDPLHKAILGLGHHQFDTTFANIHDIDVTDKGGRTPLSWAVQRCDTQWTQKLLNRGADCNRLDERGYSPLHYAALRSRTCIELLVRAGADVHAMDSTFGRTALHLAAVANPSDIESVIVLTQAKSLVNARDSWGRTSLDYAVDYGFEDVARYLVTHGADLSGYDHFSDNALSYGVRKNRHSSLELLLEKGQDHTIMNEEYGTLMHMAAEFADQRTLRLLELSGLQPRDIDAKNKKGISPIQIALRRQDAAGLEWRIAFSDFLRALDEDQPDDLRYRRLSNQSNNSAVGSNSSDHGGVEDSNDEFEDAVESQS